MARHRSPKGRRAHLEPPLLSVATAAAGVGGAHRRQETDSPLSRFLSSSPARFVATVVAGGAVAATGQQALAMSLPVSTDSVALRAAFDNAVDDEQPQVAGMQVTPAIAPVRSETAEEAHRLPVADTAMLVKAADLHRASEEAKAAAAAAQAKAVEEAKAADAARAEAVRVAQAKKAEAAAAAKAAKAEAEKASAGAGQAVAAAKSGVQVVSGRLTSGFGSRWGSQHQGLDIAAPIGTPIRVPLAGTVIDSGPASGFGMWVRVRHSDGTVTVYGHINRSLVRVGQEVSAGQQIAEVGNRGRSTGPHLHIEVHTPGGKKINPKPWLDQHGVRF